MRSKAFCKKIRLDTRRISPLGLGKAYAQARGELNARSIPGVSVRRSEPDSRSYTADNCRCPVFASKRLHSILGQLTRPRCSPPS